ncbi:hypothetical protein APS56_13225 [Pseudalgibacter alginicilyticus]|uniref:Uncharacterized protein n=1 Tax=Pseudalgibacter alginicilyticus TaxID=1736674 RepID=A0A0P0CNM2_9FLAO|nr:hypothetical protein APS56_13225 [Pseudalgibacter alginicilyticus]
MYAQEANLEFNRLNTRKQTLKGHTTSQIYSIALPEAEKMLNPEYVKLKNDLEIAIIDSTSKSIEYSKAIDRFNDVLTIRSHVSAFMNSNDLFGNKLILLKEAQILALKQNIKVLLYSDDQINEKMQAGFLLLKLKPEEMKQHLNRVLLALDNVIVPLEQPDYQDVIVLRRKLRQTDKMIAIDKPNNKKGYTLQHAIGAEHVTGNFFEVGRYFVLNAPTNGFSKGQLITQRTFLNYGISKKKLSFNGTKVLIKNIDTEEMYLVDNNFLDGFSVKSQEGTL